MAIKLYHFFKNNGLRGRGLFVRLLSRWHPRARRFPFPIEGLGTVHANLRLGSVLPLFDYAGGDLGQCTHLAETIGRFLQSGDRLWDIGANIGTIALHFAQGRFGLAGIEIFEPNPDLVANLQMIFENFPAVTIHAAALGDQKGEAQLHLESPDDSCRGSLAEVQAAFGGKRLTVPTETGDAVWRENGKVAPAVIKIDVEGFEPQVLAGMREMIASARPVIFFEHIFLSEEKIRAHIPDGYTWFLILDQGGVTANIARRNESHDSVLVPPEQLAKLPALVD